MSIEVKSLSKNFGNQTAVNAISFQIARGEIVGFLGPNGAGKSTTMKMITGYLQPDSGEAIVSGINTRNQPIESKRKIGYLPEANPLYYDMYVREYLDFIAGIHKLANRKQRIEEVIGITGVGPESNKKNGQLSKGYKQRVGLASALIHDPEVLILDEPTSGLDPNQIVEIRQVIKELGRNKTVLFSSHILQEVEAVCNRVIIINKGALVADDKLDLLEQRTKDFHVVIVEFKEAVDPGLLDGMNNVNQVEKMSPTVLKIQTANPESVRKQLFERSLLHNLNIVSLQSENRSLEDIFRNLTTEPH